MAVRVFGGVGACQASFPVASMARVPGMSTARSHAWLKRPRSARTQSDAVLLQRIRTLHATSRSTHGMPRVHAELRAEGGKHGRKRTLAPDA